jgi:FdhE protein
VNRLPRISLRGRGSPAPAQDLSASAQRQISQILSAQPESAAWLVIVEAVLREVPAPAWDEAAAATQLAPERAQDAPLLAGAQIPVNRLHAEDWLGRLLLLASNATPDAAPLARAAQSPFLDAPGLLEAAINADDTRIEAMASDVGVPPESLGAVAELAAIPLLQALRRRFAPAVSSHWHEGSCPICGDWPRLAELRGLERARRLRCARCGGDWEQPGVRCPYCDAAGQGTRATLISEQDGEARKVETCTRCRGYLKVVSTLRAWPGDEVSLADLATIDLDLVALERNYERPEPRGGLGVRIG